MTRLDIGNNTRLYERDEWDARPWRDYTRQYDSQLKEIFLHHSDHARAEIIDHFGEQVLAMQGMQNYHMDAKGWDDIGYHFVPFQMYGNIEVVRVFRGRPVNHVPAAQAYHNTGTVAICTVGNFQGDDAVKWSTVAALVDVIRHVLNNNADRIRTVGGHRDVTLTTCPGDALYSKIPNIAQRTGLSKFTTTSADYVARTDPLGYRMK